MRKKIVAGNWKMNTNLQEGIELAKAINAKITTKNCDCESTGVVIAPPFSHLYAINEVIDSNKICLTAQNCAAEEKGAYTGEISAEMLKSLGVKAVILGHSERRAYYGETSETLLKKIKLVQKNGMKPIFCCGEKLDERESGNHFEIVENQIKEVLFELSADDFENSIIAYEPVWAIGTGVTASSDQAQEIHAFIRKIVADKFGQEIADKKTILYGGSCKPSNAKELFAQKDIDGGLIGGASLKADDFMGIIEAI